MTLLRMTTDWRARWHRLLRARRRGRRSLLPYLPRELHAAYHSATVAATDSILRRALPLPAGLRAADSLAPAEVAHSRLPHPPHLRLPHSYTLPGRYFGWHLAYAYRCHCLAPHGYTAPRYLTFKTRRTPTARFTYLQWLGWTFHLFVDVVYLPFAAM